MRAIGVVLALGVFVLARPVFAMEFGVREKTGGGAVVLAQGEIVPGDVGRFREAVRRAGSVDEVWLASPGGVTREGMDLARTIRSLGLATRIPGTMCASSCTFVFLGGTVRTVDPGGRFLVHMFSSSGSPKLLEAVTAVIAKAGPAGAAQVVKFVEQQSAQEAAQQAAFVLEMSVSLRLLFPTYNVPNDGVYELTRAELRSFNVVNSE